MGFKDRVDAGCRLGEALTGYKGEKTVVYGLPRGGVAVAAEVARRLGAPLDVIIPRKIGHPHFPEYAIGAVTEHGKPVWNWTEARRVSQEWRNEQTARAREEAHRHRQKYQSGKVLKEDRALTAIIVDDGAATGLTMRAAFDEVAQRPVDRTVIAVPVAPPSFEPEMRAMADDVVVLYTPPDFGSVGSFYDDFEQTTDEEVRQLLLVYPEHDTETVDLPSINALVATITHYPVESAELAARARRLHMPASVTQFFDSIPHSWFADKKEIIRRSQESKILIEEEAAQPPEQLHSYD